MNTSLAMYRFKHRMISLFDSPSCVRRTTYLQAIVLEVIPFGLHGVTYYDVTVQYADRSVEQARLGPEGVPDDLERGESVLATRVANIVISLRRP